MYAKLFSICLCFLKAADSRTDDLEGIFHVVQAHSFIVCMVAAAEAVAGDLHVISTILESTDQRK